MWFRNLHNYNGHLFTIYSGIMNINYIVYLKIKRIKTFEKISLVYLRANLKYFYQNYLAVLTLLYTYYDNSKYFVYRLLNNYSRSQRIGVSRLNIIHSNFISRQIMRSIMKQFRQEATRSIDRNYAPFNIVFRFI